MKSFLSWLVFLVLGCCMPTLTSAEDYEQYLTWKPDFLSHQYRCQVFADPGWSNADWNLAVDRAKAAGDSNARYTLLVFWGAIATQIAVDAYCRAEPNSEYQEGAKIAAAELFERPYKAVENARFSEPKLSEDLLRAVEDLYWAMDRWNQDPSEVCCRFPCCDRTFDEAKEFRAKNFWPESFKQGPYTMDPSVMKYGPKQASR